VTTLSRCGFYFTEMFEGRVATRLYVFTASFQIPNLEEYFKYATGYFSTASQLQRCFSSLLYITIKVVRNF